MGMSSSQARLLTLTARMHDIEYRAQRLEAQKLQMANESRRAYESYLEALDATKIQYKSINNDGSITFKDATLNALENGAVSTWEGEASNKTFLLKNGFTDEIYVTPTFANAFGIRNGEKIELGTLDEYLHEHNVWETLPVYKTEYQTDYTNVTSFNPAINKLISTPEAEVEGTTESWSLSGNIERAVLGEYHSRYTIGDITNAPAIVSTPVTKNLITRNAGSSLINLDTICKQNASDNGVVYSTYLLAKNIYLLEAVANNYEEADYNNLTNKGHITDYTNKLNTLFESSLYESDTAMMNDFQHLACLIDYAFENCDSSQINDILGKINTATGGMALVYDIESYLTTKGHSAANYTANYADFLTVSSVIPKENTDSYNPTVKTEEVQVGTASSISCQYSKEDIIGYAAKCMADEYGYTLESLLEEGGENYDKLAAIRNLDDSTLGSEDLIKIAKLAYFAANSTSEDGDVWKSIINKLNSNESISEYFSNSTYVPEGWNGLSALIAPSNTIFTDNGDVNNEYAYRYSKNDIARQIAMDMYNNSTYSAQLTGQSPEEIYQTILSKLDEKYGDNNNKWIELASAYGTDDWSAASGNVLASVYDFCYNDNVAALDSFSNSHHIPAGITTTLNNTDRISFNHVEAEEGTPAVNGKINIPNIDNIAMNILVAFQKNGVDIPPENVPGMLTQIKAKLNAYSGDNNRSIAEINNMVCTFINSNGNNNKDKITDLYNFVTGTSSTFNVPSTYASNYDFEFDETLIASEPEYGKKAVQVETDELTWDTSDPRYKELSKEYYMLKSLEGCTFKVIEEELCNSTEFVSNWLTLNEGYLLEFDNSLYEMVDTNVAVTTHLQEVSDEKDLKKAEAKYEADMRRIDQKDRRYDTQLAALDTERNAVKQEMETVKTVAKDNVDRTFRLFS